MAKDRYDLNENVIGEMGRDLLGDRGSPSRLAQTTHSLGIKPHPHDRSIARQLLGKKPNDGTVKIPMQDGVTLELRMKDQRPLIDKVHEATFTNPIGLQWFNDLYGLRTLLRKAKCFTIDDETSKMVADFSIAIGHDLESTRRISLPPFPVTWIDINNRARLDRIKELGGRLTPTASGETEGPPVERVGWLIHPAQDMDGYYMTYFCEVGQGILAAPLSYWWHCGEPNDASAVDDSDQTSQYVKRLTFGMADAVNVSTHDACVMVTPMHIEPPNSQGHREQISNMMTEIAGELRHLWGLLLALNATSQFGVEASMADQLKHSDVRQMPNGKPLLPLEHKVLHLHLRKRWPAAKVVQGTIAHHKVRWHEVRGHVRTLRNADGSIRKQVPVKPHERGDKELGRIEKTYLVEK
jgi:hypothetical protein